MGIEIYVALFPQYIAWISKNEKNKRILLFLAIRSMWHVLKTLLQWDQKSTCTFKFARNKNI